MGIIHKSRCRLAQTASDWQRGNESLTGRASSGRKGKLCVLVGDSLLRCYIGVAGGGLPFVTLSTDLNDETQPLSISFW